MWFDGRVKRTRKKPLQADLHVIPANDQSLADFQRDMAAFFKPQPWLIWSLFAIQHGPLDRYLEFRRKVVSLSGANVDTPENAARTLETLKDIGSRFRQFVDDCLPTAAAALHMTVEEAQSLLEMFNAKTSGVQREHGLNFDTADALLAACVALARAMLAVMYGCYSRAYEKVPGCWCNRGRASGKMKKRVP